MNNKTNIRLIFSIFTALVAISGFVFGSYYINGLTEKTSLLKEEIEAKEIKIKRIQNLNKSAEKTSLDREKLKNHFVDSNKAIDFVSSLEDVASKLGLQYSTNSIENVEVENLSLQNKQLLRISMSLSGGWRTILTYLLYIESLPYALNIEKLEMIAEGVPSPSVQSNTQIEGLDSSSTKPSLTTVKTPVDSKWKMGITFSVVKVKDKK